MGERWSRDQVLALASDASSRKAAEGVSAPGKWSGTGFAEGVALWGECKGSGAKPYRACVDLAGPAYRCSCPSRKFPCKHALGVLLLWSAGEVPAQQETPDWVREWLDQRRERAEKTVARTATVTKDPEAARRRAEQREARVAAGLEELDTWLCDQVRQGLAGAQRAPYKHWDDLAKRLVDAQASSVANVVSGLAVIPRLGEDWPGRLLEEYAMLRLLVRAHQRQPDLPEPLRHTVRARVGFTLNRDEVLENATPVSDHWDVLASRDEEQERLTTRRVWLRGRQSRRPALILSFAAMGQALDSSLVPGMAVDAALAYYPGAPLRALVKETRGPVPREVPAGDDIEAALTSYANALAGDPWLGAWPVVLKEASPQAAGLTDTSGRTLPLQPAAGDQWRLVAMSGGHPVTVAGEWTPRGLRPLTAWDADGRMVIL